MTINLKYEIELVGKNPALYLVKCAGITVGQLEKYANKRGCIHPWKAYKGSGMNREYIGAFYGKCGKQDAIRAIFAAMKPV